MLSRSAVLAPGGNNNADIALLMYARLAAERRGAWVRVVWWDLAQGRGFDRHREMVATKVAAAVDELTSATGAAPLVIGKSLGSLAAPVVADRGLPAVWFTPLLTDEPTVTALRRASAPFLLAGVLPTPTGTGESPGHWLATWSRSTAPVMGCSFRALRPRRSLFSDRCSRPWRPSSIAQSGPCPYRRWLVTTANPASVLI